MRVTHSLLHPDDLARLVEREYTIASPVKARLLARGFNDTYLITDAAGGRRALRVYNRDKYWIRSDSDLRFELELLEHLAAAGHGVVRPYPRSDGDALGRLTAPEGERCFALFTYAAGVPSYEGAVTADQWRRLGSDIGRMHLAMDTFQPVHDRYHLDQRILVERPLAALEPYAGSADDHAQLSDLGKRMTAEIERLRAIPGAYGIIHADLHRGNIHVDDGKFVVFDFDHCGFGLRAYDLATFYCRADASEEDRDHWSAIIAGYQETRPLSPQELDSLPIMAACRAMWDLGDWAGAAERTGDAWITSATVTRLLEEVRKAMMPPMAEPL